MFFQKYLPNLQKYKVQFQDRLARDSDNETIKSFITLIDELSTKFSLIDQTSETVSSGFSSTEIAKLSDADLKDRFDGKELEFYLLNRSQVDALKTYMESYEKVNNASNNFFDKK